MSPNSPASIESSAAAPPAAQRARSALARANGAAVSWLDGPGVGAPGHVTGVVIEEPGSSSSADTRPVVVEVADAAPLPCADRIRARVRLYGHGGLVDGCPDMIRLRPRRVELEESGTTTVISPGSLWAAEPDLLATSEGAFLSHLASGHAALMRTLVRLLEPEVVEGARRAVPLALDGYGLVFRVEYHRGHRDVRLPFPTPATSADEVRAGMRDLAMRAHRCGLSDVLRAGRAAARICSPESDDG